MTIAQDVLKQEAPPYIELFKVDCSIIGQPVYYLTNTESQVTFGANTYYPFPISISGIESTSSDAPARPTIEVGNLQGLASEFIKLFGSLAFLYDDLVGIEITYIRTFTTYLGLGTEISAPPLKYTVAKKISHNRVSLSFELRSPLDKERAYLPKRQMLKRDFPGLGVNKNVG